MSYFKKRNKTATTNTTVGFFISLLMVLFASPGDVRSQPTRAKKQITAKPLVFPILPKDGKKYDDFVPKNWSIADTVIGDLNKDNQEDAAIVLAFKKNKQLKSTR